MLQLYWGCLIGGVIFTLVTVFLGDIIGNMLDGIFDFLSVDGPHFLQPLIIVGGITVFGGAGIILEEYTKLGTLPVVILSLLIAIFSAVLIYFLYVKPMEDSENSTAYSVQDLVGKLGEVITAVPANGYGEVIVKVGAGNTNQIAASFEKEDIPNGSRVVVVEVKDHTLYVSRYPSDEMDIV